MGDITLFSPLQLGPIELPNRILMAPLTRCRASAGGVPNALMATYYAQRATAGLIISEATQISPRGIGHPGTPGLYTDEQVAGWKDVTAAVHAKGGRIVAQLWHVGRASHPVYQPNGDLPVAPSAIAPVGMVMTPDGPQPYVTPRALITKEIAGVVEEYRQGAKNALEAGFDGVELHNANGYLPDQFLRDATNQRSDRYGGSVENRARFSLEVMAALIGVWGADRVGIRLSPSGVFNGMSDSNPEATFGHIIKELNKLGLAYLHITEAIARDLAHGARAIPTSLFRPLFDGNLIVNGGFTFERAQDYLARREADAIAFGVSFIANPDLPERFRQGAPLNPPDVPTFYGGGPQGYTDYPTLDAST